MKLICEAAYPSAVSRAQIVQRQAAKCSQIVPVLESTLPSMSRVNKSISFFCHAQYDHIDTGLKTIHANQHGQKRTDVLRSISAVCQLRSDVSHTLKRVAE